MDQFTKEGRKLRPRKAAAQSQDHSSFEKVEFHFGERKDNAGEGGERRSYGESRSYGERRPRQYGENRGSYGENRGGYGERRPRQYGENREGGEQRRSYGEGGSYGERRPRQYGENRGGYGERRPRQYGENREGGEQRRSYGEGGSYGERRPRPAGGRQSFGGERKNFGGKPFGAKKGAPGRKGGPKPVPHFNKETNEGISRMIERRPVVNGNESAETFNSPIQDVVRLNKFIANSGVCSRREADTLIQAGVVTVNGEVVTELGTKVNVNTDDIRFNGERLKGEEKVYIVMNKPKGFVTTASDPHAEKTVIDLLKGCAARVYPVGRLDKNTTGVLMLTNDGEIAERLTHPAYDKKKIYQVALDRELSEEDRDKILAGVTLTDGEVNADELEYIDANDRRKLGIEIHSGKNRVVRRIFESLGYSVKALDRVYFAGLTKKGLKKGEWRYLSEGEANILKMGAYV